MSTRNKKDYNVAAENITMTPGEMVRHLRELKEWSQLEKLIFLKQILVLLKMDELKLENTEQLSLQKL